MSGDALHEEKARQGGYCSRSSHSVILFHSILFNLYCLGLFTFSLLLVQAGWLLLANQGVAAGKTLVASLHLALGLTGPLLLALTVLYFPLALLFRASFTTFFNTTEDVSSFQSLTLVLTITWLLGIARTLGQCREVEARLLNLHNVLPYRAQILDPLAIFWVLLAVVALLNWGSRNSILAHFESKRDMDIAEANAERRRMEEKATQEKIQFLEDLAHKKHRK